MIQRLLKPKKYQDSVCGQ